VIKFLTAIESGRHLEMPFCNYVKVQALRLEPDCEVRRSPIVVDGEVIPEDKIQAVVSDLCMRVVSK
jgi:diacylglycerol kinase family enzyme